MAQPAPSDSADAMASILQRLIDSSFLFQPLAPADVQIALAATSPTAEKLYSNRPIYTAFQPHTWLDGLYVVIAGGPVIMRSTPLDRIIALTYPRGCFGLRSLPVGLGQVGRAFPSLVEAYKTTDVVKVPCAAVQHLYTHQAPFRERFDLMCELRQKFQYHLLNCSTYPPQAVAALLRALIYQERELGDQPQANGHFRFDLSVDLIARACQLNHRTVEQVLKGMGKAKIVQQPAKTDPHGDWIDVIDPEQLKAVYGATRDKVNWWPLR